MWSQFYEEGQLHCKYTMPINSSNLMEVMYEHDTGQNNFLNLYFFIFDETCGDSFIKYTLPTMGKP